jgi:hypothetical protein
MATASHTAEERARRIKLIIFDVDDVLTDEGIWLFPALAWLCARDICDRDMSSRDSPSTYRQSVKS